MSDRVRRALADVSSAAHAFLETTTDYDELLQRIARSCASVLQATCTVSLIDEGGATIRPVALHDEDPAVVAAYPLIDQPIPVNRTMIGSLGESDVMFAPDGDASSFVNIAPHVREYLSSIGVRGYIIVGMRVRGELLGVLSVMRRRPDLPPLDELERELAIHLARLAGLAIANARAFRRAEQAEELRRADARLLDATKLIDAVLENIPAMVFVKDAERLAFVRMNRAGEELLGISREALIGKTDFDFFPESEARFFVEKDRATLEGEALVDIPEEPIQTASGERWLHTKKVPLRDANGRPRWLLGISHDITDERQYIVSLRVAKEAAESANRELESFSYSVAHDLRTPLRAIDGFSQALLEDCAQLDATGKSHLVRVRAAAQRMGELIDALLMLSRVTRSEVRRAHVDLGALFRTSLATHQRLDPERQVEIVVDGDVRAIGDPQQLAVVFDNLCANAWKFTSKRAGARIELGSRLDDEHARVFFVRDNGVGFDMQFAGKLFGVFQRLHSDSEFPGTGIGLATVQRIVQRHGGRVWADGSVGHGATFSFTLGS